MQEGSRDSRPPPRVGSQPCAGDSAPVPPAVIHPEQSLPGSCYKGGGALRNNGVGHPKGEPEVWAFRGVTGTFTGSQPGGADGPETAQAAKTRGGVLQKRSGKKEGQRGWGRGDSVAAAPGRRWHRCGGSAGSGFSHLRGGAVAGAPGAQSGPEGSGQGGRQGGGAGAEFRPAPARRAAGGGCGGRGGDGAGKGPAAEPQAAGAGRWDRGPGRSQRFSHLCPLPPPAPARCTC